LFGRYLPDGTIGVIALLRQLNYDAQWYKELPPGYFHDDGLEHTSPIHPAQIFEVSKKTEIMRATVRKRVQHKLYLKGDVMNTRLSMILRKPVTGYHSCKLS